MAEDKFPKQPMPAKCRRSRTKFTEEQLKILIDAFNQKPYPGYAAKKRLALQVNTEESRIQIWFQNRRARHQFPKRPEEHLDARQGRGPPAGQTPGRGDRRSRTSYTNSQLQTLIEEFKVNPYPGIDSREKLAKEIGVPESRVQGQILRYQRDGWKEGFLVWMKELGPPTCSSCQTITYSSAECGLCLQEGGDKFSDGLVSKSKIETKYAERKRTWRGCRPRTKPGTRSQRWDSPRYSNYIDRHSLVTISLEPMNEANRETSEV